MLMREIDAREFPNYRQIRIRRQTHRGSGIFLLPDSWFNQELSSQPSILILQTGSLMSSCWTNRTGLHLLLPRHLNALMAVRGEADRCSVQLLPMNSASPSPADSTCSGMCSGGSPAPKKHSEKVLPQRGDINTKRDTSRCVHINHYAVEKKVANTSQLKNRPFWWSSEFI